MNDDLVKMRKMIEARVRVNADLIVGVRAKQREVKWDRGMTINELREQNQLSATYTWMIDTWVDDTINSVIRFHEKFIAAQKAIESTIQWEAS